MKRILSLTMVLILLISALAVPVFAEGEEDSDPGTSQEGGTGGNEGGGNEGGSNEGGGNEGGGNEGGGNEGGGNEGGGNEGGGNEGGGNEGGGNEDDGNEGGESACKHNWVYVEVNSTCTEKGATGYYCILCEDVKDAKELELAPHTYDNVCDKDCNVCKAVREPEHKFSTQWSKNSTKHWHACVGSRSCDAKEGLSDHYPGPAATEEKAQYCLTCGLMMMPKKSHTHKYASKLSSDASGHWYACESCEEKKDFKNHTYDSLCDPDCNDCGFLSETAHAFDDNWKSDETNHWSECSLCGEEKPAQAHIPGPEATDTEPQVCSVCGYELAPALKHEHKGGTKWLRDDAGHWKECACGEKLEAASHAWDEGTENEDTTVTYICTVCNGEKTEGEPKTPSEFPMWILFLVIALLSGVAALVLVLIMVIKNKPGKYKR